MSKNKTLSKPSDLIKGAPKQNAPELSERDLAKVSGGGPKFGGVDGESTDKDHKDTLG